jgi:hypothetical protein
MALTKCKECGAQISTKAAACPQCGAKRRSGGGNLGCGSLLLVLFVGILIVGIFSGESDRPPQAPRLSDAQCKQDLDCWGNRHLAAATTACREPVERLARYDFRWTDGMLGSKLTHFRWFDKEIGVLRYEGDAIELQNALGAWQRHFYTCVYSPTTKTALQVNAVPGRRP